MNRSKAAVAVASWGRDPGVDERRERLEHAAAAASEVAIRFSMRVVAVCVGLGDVRRL